MVNLMTMLNNLVSFVPLANSINYQPLRNHVEKAISDYFIKLGDTLPVNFYEFVLAEIEPPLLEATMRKARGNQSKAAKILGLSRGTLRKKLKQYDLDKR